MGRTDRLVSFWIGATLIARFASPLAAAYSPGSLRASRRQPTRARSWSSSPARAAPPARRPTSSSPSSPNARTCWLCRLPVDYWDYLGWKDTLASHDSPSASANTPSRAATVRSTRRRRSSTAARAIVGSDRTAVETALKHATEPGFPVPIALTAGDDAMTVKIGAAAGAAPNRGTIWLVMYDRSVSVPITRGENSGRTLTYSNVVRKLRPIAMWKGEAMTIDLPRSEMNQAKVEALRRAPAVGEGRRPARTDPRRGIDLLRGLSRSPRTHRTTIRSRSASVAPAKAAPALRRSTRESRGCRHAGPATTYRTKSPATSAPATPISISGALSASTLIWMTPPGPRRTSPEPASGEGLRADEDEGLIAGMCATI